MSVNKFPSNISTAPFVILLYIVGKLHVMLEELNIQLFRALMIKLYSLLISSDSSTTSEKAHFWSPVCNNMRLLKLS